MLPILKDSFHGAAIRGHGLMGCNATAWTYVGSRARESTTVTRTRFVNNDTVGICFPYQKNDKGDVLCRLEGKVTRSRDWKR